MLGAATPFNLVGVREYLSCHLLQRFISFVLETDGTDGYGVMAAYANGNGARTMEITFICDPNAGEPA